MKAIFTVLLGDYDNEPMPHRKFKGWHNVIITDTKPKNRWDKVILLPKTDNPKLESRRYKWLSHIYLPEYKTVAYIDANARIMHNLKEEPYFLAHTKRFSVYEEIEQLKINNNRVSKAELDKQWEFYKSQGFEDNKGMTYNCHFVRTHSEKINTICEEVFKVLEQFTYRDQIALPYVLWKMKVDVNRASINVKKVSTTSHKEKPIKLSQSINVHHITPGRSDKNLGLSINQIIQGLPDDDWICLRDIDTIPMYHEKFFIQCEELAESGKADLYGCMTNRLGLPYQVVEGMYNETDISVHRATAMQLYKDYGNEVEILNETIAGLFMLFSKQTWLKVGGYPQGKIYDNTGMVDWKFCKAIKREGLKIGLAKGVYLFHWYRMDKDRKDKSHLV